MINFSRKHIYLVLILILIISIFLIVLISGYKVQAPNAFMNSTSSLSGTEPSLTFGQITRQERIDHVEWTYAHGMKYEEYTIGNEKNLIVTFYQWLSLEDWASGGGLLIFKLIDGKPKLIWESDHVHQTRPLIKTMDMTGDGKKELLALWQNGKGELLYIYQYDGSAFNLITPQYSQGGVDKYGKKVYWPLFATSDSEIQITDLDKDGIPEVWFSSKADEAGKPVEQHYVAYKWNGYKYFLWKEQQEPFGPNQSFLDGN